MKQTVFLVICLMLTNMATAQERADFKAAEKFSSSNISKMLKSTTVNPNWFYESDKFWYSYTTTSGKKFYVVDPDRKSKSLLFENMDFAAKLGEITRQPVNFKDLELKNLELEDDNRTLSFMVDSMDYTYDLNTKMIVQGDSTEKADKRLDWATYSPDSTYIAFAKNHDLYIMRADDEDSTEIRLSEDGEKWYSYQADHGDTTSNKRLRSRARWFEDEKKLFINRSDQRKVGEFFVINTLEDPRPELEVYKYAMPGEKDVPQSSIEIFDVESESKVVADIDKYKDQTLFPYLPGETSERLYLMRMNRSSDTLDVGYINTSTGEFNNLFSDVNHPYFNWSYRQLAVINEGEELLYWSEKSGWGQLYLYNGNNGELKNKVSNGGFFVTGQIQKIDTVGRKVYFEGFGRESNIDPYYQVIYKANFDGSGFKQLTPENANHSIRMPLSNKYMVNNYSSTELPPKSVLRDNEGKVIMELESADLSLLEQAGWKKPSRFKVKADDGITDLYGIMYKPFNFDSTKKYPVISYVYPGPFTESFRNDFSITGGYNTSLAQLGFIVVSMGHRGGSPKRQKYYHAYGYENLRDYALADDKRSIEQLAERHSWIDTDNVGIFGHSGGGFMSTAALLTYPDFYDVAASSAGNHDNNIYNLWWGETHNGVTRKDVRKKDKDDNEYTETTWNAKIKTNQSLARNLKGHLLLTHGNIDNNVHPTNTLRLVEELQKAGKRFDLMIFPGTRHGYGGSKRSYYEKMMWYYFAEHLLGDYRNNIEIGLPDED
ncbi:MAG: DPP IV N-terminal domain-containing protein [Balneola sp.]